MTCNKGALNPVHAADVDQFMPAWVHRAAPCVRASLHLVAKVGHFAPLFFRRFTLLRYSFADLLRSYSWAASLRSDLLRSYSFAASLRYSFADLLRSYSFAASLRSDLLRSYSFAASLRSVILSPHRSAPTCFVSFTASLRSDDSFEECTMNTT